MYYEYTRVVMPAGAAAMREPTCERILSYHARTQVQLSATPPPQEETPDDDELWR